MPIERFFRLSEAGVRCGPDGLAVGPTPLVVRAGGRWAARPRAELETELSDLYGLPIDLAGREHRLAGIAWALARGETALAAIGALLLRFPDPPSLAKGAPARGSAELARRLVDSGLLDKDWDPDKHPRVGEKPNPGWFAAKPEEPRPQLPAVRSNRSLVREAFRTGLRGARTLVRKAAAEIIEDGRWTLWLGPELRLAIEGLLRTLEPTPLNEGEQQVLDQIRAAADPPRTLEELQQPPTQNELGYERHHIVEQNPDNIAKSPLAAALDKFGRPAIDDPSNLVTIPRLKHEQITSYYNSLEVQGQPGLLHRDIVDQLDFEGQRAEGLEALRRYGVLQ